MLACCHEFFPQNSSFVQKHFMVNLKITLFCQDNLKQCLVNPPITISPTTHPKKQSLQNNLILSVHAISQ